LKNRLPGFHCEYKKTDTSPLDGVRSPDSFNLRPWQLECYNMCCSTGPVRNSIINATMASGKTMLGRAISDTIAGRDDDLIVIFAVPIKSIAFGFAEIIDIEMPDRTIIKCRVDEENNLLEDTSISEKSKTKRLIGKLKNRTSKRVSRRIVICSHATMARVFYELKMKKDLSCLNNIALFVDEAHHIICDEFGSTNKSGAMINYFIRNSEDNLSVHLMTGTPFRADQSQIIPQSFYDTANVYRLPYDRHFEENCRYLKRFTVDFLLYDKNWFTPIKDAFEEKVTETIVFLPAVNSKFATVGGKFDEVEKIISSIAGRKNFKREDNDLFTIIWKNDKPIIIVDLVDDRNMKLRDRRVEYIQKHQNKVDVVISLKVAGEGFNWNPSKRLIIVGIKHSLTEFIQMAGRAFRDDPSKADIAVEILQIIPRVNRKRLDKDKARDQLNNLMKAMYASLIFETIMQPKMYIPIDKKLGKKKAKQKRDEIYRYWLDSLSESEQINLENDIIGGLQDYVDVNRDKMTKKKLKEGCEELVVEILEGYGISEHKEDLAKMFINQGYARTEERIESFKKALCGIDVSNIDLDLIEEMKKCGPVGYIVGFTNGVCGVKTLREFRETIQYKVDLDQEEVLKWADQWKEEHGEWPNVANGDFEVDENGDAK